MQELLRSIEECLAASNWYAALAVSLVLPDIAGWVNDPTQTSRARYAAWFDQYVRPRYENPGGDYLPAHTFLSGDDCYALRCSLLHEGRDEIGHQRARDSLDRFQITAPRPGVHVHCNQFNQKLQLQVDAFCEDMCRGVTDWLASIPVADVARRGRLQELVTIQIDGPIGP